MEPVLQRDAHLHGLTRDQLRGAAWTHPTDGVALPREHAADLAERCAAVALVLGHDAVFTHLTSAALRSWWLPRLDPFPIIACTRGEAPHLDRRGVYVRRCDLPDDHRTSRHGVPVASAAWTIVELAEHLSLLDLVVAIDCALHRQETSIDEIRSTMRKGRRGVRVLRRALDLVDDRSESPWETLLRLLHVLSGITVEPQHTVRDAAGEILWRLDLLIVGTSRAPEYDGGAHRRREVQHRDLRREKVLARHGVERYGYTSPEILDAPMSVLRDAESALGLSHDPTRLKIWQHEIERSSFTREGWIALRRRLDRFARPSTPRPSSGAK